jgi:hypothetical protein
MNFRERSFEQIPFSGFSADYVYRESKRAMDGAANTKIAIWSGIDIDIPTAFARPLVRRMRWLRHSAPEFRA